ncbi:MAG: hypothetical protein LC737_10155, partial [Chloroflexi bacterium]|nr:hypothetical protein [Chloroflexota bacterium]
FEDWYVLDGSCALDVINEVAVSPALASSHGAIAQRTAAGAGGLYRLRTGDLYRGDSHVYWIGKPRSMSYEAFYRALEVCTRQPHVSLFRRQMVLGPAPEFCLRAPTALDIPTPLSALALTANLIYSAAAKGNFRSQG